MKNKQKGFTLIEILVVIGIIAILAAIVVVAINPARQFAQARNSQRVSNVNAILNAIGQNMADNKGIFTCSQTLPAVATTTPISRGGINIRSCVVPTYLSEIPIDPKAATITCTDTDCTAGTYNTLYTVFQDSNGRVNVCAPEALNETAVASTTICVTR